MFDNFWKIAGGVEGGLFSVVPSYRSKEEQKGDVAYNQDNFEQALVFYLGASKKSKFYDQDIRLHSNIGDCYFELKEFDNAIKYYKNADKCRKKLSKDNDKDGDIINGLINIARCYVKKTAANFSHSRYYEEALKYLETAENLICIEKNKYQKDNDYIKKLDVLNKNLLIVRKKMITLMLIDINGMTDSHINEEHESIFYKHYGKLSHALKHYLIALAMRFSKNDIYNDTRFKALSQNKSIEEKLPLCSIMYEIMSIPVLSSNGQYYDLGMLLMALDGKQECPMSRIPCSFEQIIPAWHIKKQYEAALKKIKKPNKNNGKFDKGTQAFFDTATNEEQNQSNLLFEKGTQTRLNKNGCQV